MLRAHENIHSYIEMPHRACSQHNRWGFCFPSGIYIIRNIESGKLYIGSSINFNKRKIVHYSDLKLNKHHNRYLQRSYNIHGQDAFIFSVLIYCQKDSLVYYEQKAIDLFKKYYGWNNLYNLNPHAESCVGRIISAEHRKNLSEANKRRPPPSPETRAKMSRSHRRSDISDSERINRSKVQMGRKHSAKTKAKMSKAATGRKHSPESIAKRSAKRRGCIVTEETRAKLSKVHKGKKLTDEHKRKISESHKGIGHTEESRNKISKSLKIYWSKKDKEKTNGININKNSD